MCGGPDVEEHQLMCSRRTLSFNCPYSRRDTSMSLISVCPVHLVWCWWSAPCRGERTSTPARCFVFKIKKLNPTACRKVLMISPEGTDSFTPVVSSSTNVTLQEETEKLIQSARCLERSHQSHILVFHDVFINEIKYMNSNVMVSVTFNRLLNIR